MCNVTWHIAAMDNVYVCASERSYGNANMPFVAGFETLFSIAIYIQCFTKIWYNEINRTAKKSYKKRKLDRVVVYNEDAQHFVVNHINEIVELS